MKPTVSTKPKNCILIKWPFYNFLLNCNPIFPHFIAEERIRCSFSFKSWWGLTLVWLKAIKRGLVMPILIRCILLLERCEWCTFVLILVSFLRLEEICKIYFFTSCFAKYWEKISIKYQKFSSIIMWNHFARKTTNSRKQGNNISIKLCHHCTICTEKWKSDINS